MNTESKLNSKKYRILLVIRWPVGGIRTFIRYVYNNFDHSRYSLTILAQDQPELRTLLDDLRNLDVTYIPVQYEPRQPGFLLSVAKTILLGRYDVIHSQGFMSGIYSTIPARLSRTKHVMTSHDVLLPKQFVGLKGFLKKKLFAFLFPMIDVIHSVSNDASTNLIETIPNLKKYNEKCITFPNGIEVERFSGVESRDLRKELDLPDDTFLIGFLGRFMSQKGFRYLVDALEILLKSTDLPKKPVIVATGYGGFIREDKGYLKRKGLEYHVNFLPFSPNIAPILKGLDVLAIPSLWEACPLLPMEAMVAGVPLIGTDCIGLREVLSDTPCMMVAAGNSIGLAGAIEAEIRTSSKAKAIEFTEEARRRFDVRQQAARMEALILNLLD